MSGESKQLRLSSDDIALAVTEYAFKKLGLPRSERWACAMEWELGGDRGFSVLCTFDPPTADELAAEKRGAR